MTVLFESFSMPSSVPLHVGTTELQHLLLNHIFHFNSIDDYIY